jgi:hypothetical protein
MASDEQVLANLIKHIKKEGDDPFTPLLDTYLLERNRSKNRLQEFVVPVVERGRPGGRLSPSSVCGCQRKAAFNFLAVKGKGGIDPEQQLLFDDGNWRHHKWGAVFLDMQAVLGEAVFKVKALEEPITIPSLYIAGHLDASITINGVPYIVDFKGINTWGFDRVFRSQEPLAPHVLQLLAYMRGKKVRNGFMLYDCKNTNRTKVYTVKFTKSAWAEVSEWCESVLSKVAKRTLPSKSPDCVAGSFLYEKCPYAYLCWGHHEHEKIQEYAYKDFTNLQSSWEKGLELK